MDGQVHHAAFGMRHLVRRSDGGLAAMRAAIVDHPEDAIGGTVGFTAMT